MKLSLLDKHSFPLIMDIFIHKVILNGSNLVISHTHDWILVPIYYIAVATRK